MSSLLRKLRWRSRASGASTDGAQVTGVECRNCGHKYEPSVASLPSEGRKPCPKCGSKGILVQIHAQDTVHVTETVSLGIKPGGHQRDASRRLHDIGNELIRLRALMPSFSRDEVFDRQRRLELVFVELWSLKESAEHAGQNRHDVDAAIRADFDLMLTCDIGNLVKHHALRRPWTGTVPILNGPEAVQDTGTSDFMFQMKISHGGQEHDAMTLANNALAKWTTLLRGWGIA